MIPGMFPEGAAPAAAPWLTPSADAAVPGEQGAAAAFAAALSAAVAPVPATGCDPDDEALLAAFSIEALWMQLLAPADQSAASGATADVDAADAAAVAEIAADAAPALADATIPGLPVASVIGGDAETGAREATPSGSPRDAEGLAAQAAAMPSATLNPSAATIPAKVDTAAAAAPAREPASPSASAAAPQADVETLLSDEAAPAAEAIQLPVKNRALNSGRPAQAQVQPPVKDAAVQALAPQEPATTPAHEPANADAAPSANPIVGVPTSIARGASLSGSPGGPERTAPQNATADKSGSAQAAASSMPFRIENDGLQQEQSQGDAFRNGGAQAAFTAVAPEASAAAAAPDFAQALTVSASAAPAPVTKTVAAEAPAAPAAMPPEAELENVNRIVESMRMQSRQGVHEATIRLRPEQFGEVTISIRVEKGIVSAVMHADTPAAQQWLEAQEERLRSGLADQGLNLERYVVQRDRQQEQQPREQRRQTPVRYRQKDDETAPRFEVTV